MNFLAATVSRIAGDRVLLDLAGGVGTIELAGRRLTTGRSGDDRHPSGASRTGSIPAGHARLSGAIMVVERLGANSFAYLQLADRTAVTVELDGMSDATAGATLEIGRRRTRSMSSTGRGARSDDSSPPAALPSPRRKPGPCRTSAVVDGWTPAFAGVTGRTAGCYQVSTGFA